MDRGAWPATVHGVTKELDTMEHTHTHMHTSVCDDAKEENNRNIPKKGSQPHSLKFLKGKLGVHFLFPSFRDPFTNHPEDVKSHLKSCTHHTYSFSELLCRKR